MDISQQEFVEVMYRHKRDSIDDNNLLVQRRLQEEEGVKWKNYVYKKGEVYEDTVYMCPYTSVTNRRGLGNLAYCYLIYLDDVGTIAKAPKLKPTAILETSPNNFQFFYRLSKPINVGTNRNYLNNFLKELHFQGLTDEGAAKIGQIHRIPGSINHKNGFTSRVTEFNPEIEYEIDDLYGKFFNKEPKKTTSPADIERNQMSVLNVDDELLPWLEKQNLIVSGDPQKDAWIRVICPWHHLHTDPNDKDAGYSPVGRGEYPHLRGFECHHGHCRDKNTHLFLDWVHKAGGPKVPMRFLPVKVDERYVSLRQIKDSNDYIPDWIQLRKRLRLPRTTKDGEGLQQEQMCTHVNVKGVYDDIGVEIKHDLMSNDITYFWTREEYSTYFGDDNNTIKYMIHDVMQLVGFKLHIYDRTSSEIASQNLFHTCENIFSHDQWDKKPRIEELFQQIELEHEDEYKVSYLKFYKWLLQIPQAISGYDSPKQIGNVLILSGPTRCGKSTFGKSIVGEYEYLHCDAIELDTSTASASKDSTIIFRKFLINELAEIEGTLLTNRAAKLKEILTRTHDVFRPPHGRYYFDFPRTSIFYGTTNHKRILNDPTGNRRYWPISVVKCNGFHNINMHQVICELMYRFHILGETHFLTNKEHEIIDQHNSYYEIINSDEEMVNEIFDRAGIPSTVKEYYKLVKENKDEWEPINYSNLCKLMNVDLRSEQIHNQIEARIGPSKAHLKNRKIKKPDGSDYINVRNAWYLPVDRIRPFKYRRFD